MDSSSTSNHVTAGELNPRYDQLSEPSPQLESLLSDVLPSEYAIWQEGRQGQLTTDMLAPRQHVDQLQQLLGSCYAEFAPRPSKEVDL